MTTWQRREDWFGAQVEDRFVMISLETGSDVALNETAAVMWELLAEPRDEPALVDSLVEKFAVERNAGASSVAAMLSQMTQNDLIVANSG